jgi:hypothetical protein
VENGKKRGNGMTLSDKCPDENQGKKVRIFLQYVCRKTNAALFPLVSVNAFPEPVRNYRFFLEFPIKFLSIESSYWQRSNQHFCSQ